MKRIAFTIAALALVTGCQPIPKTGNPAVRQPAQPPATHHAGGPAPSTQGAPAGPKPAATQTAAATTPSTHPAVASGMTPAFKSPWEADVSEIITKPVIATQPSTQQASAGVNAAGDAPTLSTPVTLKNPVFTLDDLKKVDTSVSTAALVRLLAMKLNNIPYQRFAGYGTVEVTPDLPEGANPDEMTNDVLTREPSGTAGAIARLVKGEASMIVISRRPTDKEVEDAGKAGVSLRFDMIATEALVFTVNTNNPASKITTDSLKRFFDGKAKTWADLKMDDFPLTHELATKPVTVAYRARGLGTEELMLQLLTGGKALPELPVSKALSSAKLVLDATNEDPEALGFSVFCYATNMSRDGRIKVLAVDGVLPEPARVASGEYPLTTPIYLVSTTNLDPDSRLAYLRKWLLAMPGQKTLAEAGYMPIIAEAWTQQRLMTVGK